MTTFLAKDFPARPNLLREYELFIDGKWQTFHEVDEYRMPNSPILFYSDFPDGEVSVPRNTEIEVRPRQVDNG